MRRRAAPAQVRLVINACERGQEKLGRDELQSLTVMPTRESASAVGKSAERGVKGDIRTAYYRPHTREWIPIA